MKPCENDAGLFFLKISLVEMKSYLILALISSMLFLFIESCTSSSPRFASNKKSPEQSKSTKSNAYRFSSKESEEEIKEDDKKPEKKEVESIIKGTKSFREEKNESIKPIEQSKMMREISKYMGVPYKSGGTSIEGMDCSGYTMVVYKNALGKELPRSSKEQAQTGRLVKLEELKFGDLVFFNTTGESASHVGIYLGDDLFAHASVTLGVTISSLQSTYYAKRFEFGRRIIE